MLTHNNTSTNLMIYICVYWYVVLCVFMVYDVCDNTLVMHQTETCAHGMEIIYNELWIVVIVLLWNVTYLSSCQEMNTTWIVNIPCQNSPVKSDRAHINTKLTIFDIVSQKWLWCVVIACYNPGNNHRPF